MADTLTTLPADGKLPDTLTGFPDSALAQAWCAEKGGKIGFYALVNGTAELQGYWVGSGGYRHPQTGQMVPSTVPPQFRTIDSLNAGELYEKERAEAEARRAAEGIPAPDYANDPVLGTQKGQTEVIQRQTPVTPKPSAPKDAYTPTLTPVPDLKGKAPHVSSRDPWSAMWTVSSGHLQAQSNISVDQAIHNWNTLIDELKNP